MKTIPSCLCIIGLAAGSAMGGGLVLMDQIGLNDGSSIDAAAGGLASQYFEASFSIYDIAVIDDFENPSGLSATAAEKVYNGGTDVAAVSGAQVNFYSTPDAAGVSLVGDVASQDFSPMPPTDVEWTGAGFKHTFSSGSAFWPLQAGTNYMSIIPVNEFGVNSQTFTSGSTIGDLNCWQANPNGGFGFGPLQVVNTTNVAYRVAGGTGNECDLPLPAECSADCSSSTGEPDLQVNVDDVLAVIASFGNTGDGVSRPQGDVAPPPSGDCVVNVDDLLAAIEQYGSDCRPKGACCFGTTGCDDDEYEIECLLLGGTWGGEGSVCGVGGFCVVGACCAADGSCVDTLAADCGSDSKWLGGAGLLCSDAPCAVAPANNVFTGAFPVFDGPNSMVGFGDATTTGDIIADCGGFERQIFNDLYYAYTATCTGEGTFSTCGAANFDTIIAVYAADGTLLGCNDDGSPADCPSAGTDFTSVLKIQLSQNSDYIVRVGSFYNLYGNANATGTLSIDCAVPAEGACCIGLDCIPALPADCEAFQGVYKGAGVPCEADTCVVAGNTCDDAIAIDCNSSTTFNNSDAGYFDSGFGVPDDTQCAGTYLDWGASPDIWFQLDIADAGTLDLSLCDPLSYDTSIVLYSGSDCGALTQIACNGDASVETGCQSYYSGLYGVPVSAGDSLYVRVGGWNGETGPGTLSVTCIGADATGACCLRDEVGTCIPDQTADECAALSGNWNANAACADVTCNAYIVCNGLGEGPTPPEGAWTAATSDAGSGFVRAGVSGGASAQTIEVWGLPLAYNGGFAACADALEATVTIAVHDINFVGLASAVAVYSNEGVSYADIYPLGKWTAEVGYSAPHEYVSAQSGSAGQGECWFLWMSADAGASFVDSGDGLGFVAEEFGVAFCITE